MSAYHWHHISHLKPIFYLLSFQLVPFPMATLWLHQLLLKPTRTWTAMPNSRTQRTCARPMMHGSSCPRPQVICQISMDTSVSIYFRLALHNLGRYMYTFLLQRRMCGWECSTCKTRYSMHHMKQAPTLNMWMAPPSLNSRDDSILALQFWENCPDSYV